MIMKLAPLMKEVIKGSIIPARADDRLQTQRIPENLRQKIEAKWRLVREGGEIERIQINNADNAIVEYARTNNRGVELIHYMRAEILQIHLGRPRQEFPMMRANDRMMELGCRPADDRGHILAHSLGMRSKNATFNLNFFHYLANNRDAFIIIV